MRSRDENERLGRFASRGRLARSDAVPGQLGGNLECIGLDSMYRDPGDEVSIRRPFLSWHMSVPRYSVAGIITSAELIGGSDEPYPCPSTISSSS